MSKQQYQAELRREVGQLEAKMAEAKADLAKGAGERQVEAAGELHVLEDRQSALKANLARLEKTGDDGIWQSIKTEIDEDLHLLRRRFQLWSDKYSGI